MWIPSAKRLVPVFVEHLSADLQQQVGTAWRPLHLLLLDHPFAHHLVNCRLNEAGADPLSIPIPLSIVDDERCVVGDVGLQFAYVLKHPCCRITIWTRLLLAIFVVVPDLQIFLQMTETSQPIAQFPCQR